MPTIAQIKAARTNARKSTGPGTPEGKSASSRNATKLGLFSAQDFILPADQLAYEELSAGFYQELTPEGPIEETLTLEIIRASWRLQRCGKAEAAYADQIIEAALEGRPVVDPINCTPENLVIIRVPFTPVDPLQNEAGQRFQAAIDRARAHANNTFRRALADLRRIQAERGAPAQTQNEAPAPTVTAAALAANASTPTAARPQIAAAKPPSQFQAPASSTPAATAERTQPPPIAQLTAIPRTAAA